MSSILKALQKLERERETRQGKPANIHKGILREERRLRKGQTWPLLLSISVTALAAALLTYAITGKSRDKETPASLPTPPATTQAAKAPTTVRPAPAVVALPAPVIRQTPPPVIETAPPQKRQPAQQIQPTPAPAARQQATASPAAQSAAAPSQLTLNVAGVGWREEPASRIAVINGSPVGEGALIDGAKVEEIFPDRVRFSFEKKLFDVPVGKSASPH